RTEGVQARTAGGSGRSEICVEAFDAASRERLRDYLADTWDLRPTLHSRGARQMAVLTFSKDETAKLHALIAPFIHSSMDYKLLPEYQGRGTVEPVFAEPRDALVPLPVTSIRRVDAGRSSHRFD